MADGNLQLAGSLATDELYGESEPATSNNWVYSDDSDGKGLHWRCTDGRTLLKQFRPESKIPSLRITTPEEAEAKWNQLYRGVL